MKSLKYIHHNHQGKASDKWEQYLNSYEIILSSYRDKPINFLEIGIQNGGSLEIWSQYFAQAQNIVGCDINPKCAELQYEDKRIHLIIGDITAKITQKKLSDISTNFDIIIDDGSHTSRDIINTFVYYFDKLNDDGIIIFEDLHCSYWYQYDGGLYHPYSSVSFFKSLIDIINYEHWGLPIDKDEILHPFYQHYNISPTINLSHIHSVEFINSMCVIKKKSPIENLLGNRIITGKVATVETSIYQYINQKNSTPNQSDNPYRLSALDQITQLENKYHQATDELRSLLQQIDTLNQKLHHQENQLLLSEKNNHALQAQYEERSLQLQQADKRFLKYKKLWILILLKPLIKLELAIHSLNRYRKGFRNLMRYKGSFGKAYQTVRRNFKKHGLQSTKTLLRHSLNGQFLPIQPPTLNTPNHNYKPKVSVIIPNYNHEKYLKERLTSIINQSYKNIELIILDDNSSDNSVQVIKDFFKDRDIPYQLIVNEKNTGNVFRQWKKGIELATGDIIWICESDDSCDSQFLNNILPCLADPAVNLAFGQIQFIDQRGNLKEGLDNYRENAEADIWHSTCVRPAFTWFNNAFGVHNVYANASGGIFRRQVLHDTIWDKACEFKICGDWYLYLHLAGSGKIAYTPNAISYFRQHEHNTSASNFHQMYYYQEHFSVLSEICKMWQISQNTKMRFISEVKNQYHIFDMHKNHGEFDVIFANEINKTINKEKTHVQLYFLGFHPGGGELFPIVLANQLYKLGHLVSMVALDLDNINKDMKQKLHSGIPIYHISDLARDRNFFDSCGVDIIHTHISGADRHLVHYLQHNQISIPYVVTMHGSHDQSFADYSKNSTEQMIYYVSKWVYIADKNLDFFEGFNLPSVVKFPNAMPLDNKVPNSSRKSLDINEDDVVFAFAARGIPEKGWVQLTQAFLQLLECRQDKKIHLILMGSGSAQEQAIKIANHNQNIHFLGYESAVNGVLRYSDCLVLPSRFAGESYPLFLIQGIQEGLPCIATDIGEIKNMITADTKEISGILIPNTPNDDTFIQHLTDALDKMCQEDLRLQYKSIAQKISNRYDLKSLSERYFDLYTEVIHEHFVR